MKINNIKLNFKANKMSPLQAKYIEKELTSKDSVDIICHDTTDKDSANCALLIFEYLKQKGISSRIILSQDLASLGLRKQDCNIVQIKDLKEEDKKAPTTLCVDFSANGRISPKAAKLIESSENVLCFDHHSNQNLFQNPLEITSSLEDYPNKISKAYIDTSAKSATSIIYRYFEALGLDINEDQAYDIYAGLVSDCVKKGLIDCNGEEGTIKAKKELKQDKNAYEIFLKIDSMIKPELKTKLAKEIDIMCSLSEDEKDFYYYLYKNLHFSKNKKVAYVEIPINDEFWEKLGKDNSRTSTILNRFRQRVLNNEGIGAKTVITFYQANDNYRLSIHSKQNLKPLYETVYSKLDEKYNLLSIGGHSDRGGGKITTQDKEQCHQFVVDVINCANELV